MYRKESKYAPLQNELRRRYPGYKTEQHNIIIDALGGSLRSVKESFISNVIGLFLRECLFKLHVCGSLF